MFRIETLVYVCLTLSPALTSAAEATTNPFAGLGQDRTLCNTYDKDSRTKAGRASILERAKYNFGPNLPENQLIQKYRNFVCSTGSSSSNDCDEAAKNFNTAREGFSSACSTLGLPDSGPEGHISCSWSKERCNCLSNNLDDDSKDLYECDEVRGNSNRSRESETGLIDLKHAEQNIKWCPQRDMDDTERYEKQLKDSQDLVKELRKKTPELLGKLTEGQEKVEAAKNAADAKISEAQDKLEADLREIKRKHEESEQQAETEMVAIAEKMDAAEAQARRFENDKIDAEVVLGRKKAEAKLQCHQTALQQVAALQTKKMDSIKKNMPQDDFNGLLKQVGVSSRRAWQDRAKEFYRQCLASAPHLELILSLEAEYEKTIRSLDQQIASLRAEERRLKDSMNQIMSKSGCAASATMMENGRTGENRLCRSLRQTQEDIVTAQNSAKRKMDQAQKEAATAERQAAQKEQLGMMQYAEAQRELNEEQLRMENLRAYLDLKRRYNKGGGNKEAAKELANNSSKLRSAAYGVDRCCADQVFQSTDSKCQDALRFIKSLHGTPAESVKDDSSAAAPQPGGKGSSRGQTQQDKFSVDPQSDPGGGVRETPTR